MVGTIPGYYGQTVGFSKEKIFISIKMKRIVGNIVKVFWEVYLLYPWMRIEVVNLRNSNVEAGFTSNEYEKNQAVNM